MFLSVPTSFLSLSLSPPSHTHTHTQENHLGSSLHIDSVNLAASASLTQDKIMAAPLPSQLEEELCQRLAQEPFCDSFVAVRSSGTDEVLKGLLGKINVINEQGIMNMLYMSACVHVYEATNAFCSLCYVHAP